MAHHKKKPPAVAFLFDNSIFLIAGAVLALVWANTAPDAYHDFVNFDLAGGTHHEEPEPAAEDPVPAPEREEGEAAADGDSGHHGFTIHFLINDILMALFFAIAGKEVWEALLPGGPLSKLKTAATPLLATLGGIVGPAAVYLLGVMAAGEMETLSRGWAVPCATDIAFSYLVARLIFGPGHPAIAFLLLLAIADDAAGLIILAVVYPQAPLELLWMALCGAAVALGFGFRKLKLQSFWWYLLIPGVMSWFAFYKAGIHPALGLIPIIPCMPHAGTDLGIFAIKELHRDDTLNAFEHGMKDPVEIILGMFGLVNAGVGFGAVGTGTWVVLAGLLIGKPVGITLFTLMAQKWFKLEVPGGMSYRHIVTLGMIAGIGFTVALFVSTAAFPVPKHASQATLDSVKMGALASFGAAILAFIIAKALGIKPGMHEEASAGDADSDAAGGQDESAGDEAGDSESV